jgi:hypothetical protein
MKVVHDVVCASKDSDPGQANKNDQSGAKTETALVNIVRLFFLVYLAKDDGNPPLPVSLPAYNTSLPSPSPTRL